MAHKPQKELQKELEEAATRIKIGRTYVHYKSPTMRYEVKGLAVNTEHDTISVIYQALYDEQLTFYAQLRSGWMK